jgi:hypothetical protein
VRALAEKEGMPTAEWAVDLAETATMGDAEMLRRAVRLALEHMARPSATPRLTITTHSDGGRPALHLRAETPPSPLVPPDPEERPSGDPTGAVLGFALAFRILDSHGGRLEERDGGLWMQFPPA